MNQYTKHNAAGWWLCLLCFLGLFVALPASAFFANSASPEPVEAASPEPVEAASPKPVVVAVHNALNQLTAHSSEGGTLFHGTVSEPGKVFVQQLDGGGAVVESVEAQLYGGNEFYATLDLPVGSHTLRIIARDIHGETSTQDYSYTVTSDPGDSFDFDAAGNMTTWTKADGTVVEFEWDAANRLRAIEVDSVQIQSFEYDGAGRMVRATDASGNRNDYYWDGLERLGRENVDVSPNVYRRYLTQGFTESLDGATANSFFTLRDHLGSTREVLDDAYAIVAKYNYSPWGEVEKLSGTIDADQLYTGHLYFADSETPLHLAPYRAYQPQMGRWLSRDFLGETGPDGSNIYGYARNNPINEADATGLASSLNTPSGQALMAYLYFEAASSTVDIAEAARTAASDCSSSADTINALGAVALGLVAPGPGTAYTKGASGAIDGVRAVGGNGTKQFGGFEFRAVRDLGHVDNSTLRAMQKHGFAAKTKNGNKIVLHHHQQNPAGPIIEVPAPNHSIGNVRQHPFGNQIGSGLTPDQRSAFDQIRVDYWKQRAADELQRRGL